MLFNSLEFLLFLPAVFVMYWFVFARNLKLQNLLILVASYMFYGWWDWRFLSLIALSTVVDYLAGLRIADSADKAIKKRWLTLSMIFNLGLLGFFKYYNFFIESWVEAFAVFGWDMDTWTLRIVLPVGISFYTFQTMSYSLDIYYDRLKPTKDFISFASFVSFFPQLVAGPIERASNLLPQILSKRKFDFTQATDGLRLIAWGMFKKVVVADTLAPVVNDIFGNYQNHSGGTLILGAIYFAFQIYGDFSGYSDIAIGTSKLFGIELMSNFKYPYFSRSVAEFWRRWHISLSTWFRDYLYIPLGGSRGSKLMAIRNIFIIFVVSGFWHGANWTFIAWGGIHALMFVPLFVMGVNRANANSIIAEHSALPSIKELAQVGLTFVMVTVAWVFFRAESITMALDYLAHFRISGFIYKSQIIYPVVLLLAEWFIRKDERKPFARLSPLLTVLILVLVTLLFRYQDEGNIEFIYFQF